MVKGCVCWHPWASDKERNAHVCAVWMLLPHDKTMLYPSQGKQRVKIYGCMKMKNINRSKAADAGHTDAAQHSIRGGSPDGMVTRNL